jgi:hypothetical protein
MSESKAFLYVTKQRMHLLLTDEEIKQITQRHQLNREIREHQFIQDQLIKLTKWFNTERYVMGNHRVYDYHFTLDGSYDTKQTIQRAIRLFNTDIHRVGYKVHQVTEHRNRHHLTVVVTKLGYEDPPLPQETTYVPKRKSEMRHPFKCTIM